MKGRHHPRHAAPETKASRWLDYGAFALMLSGFSVAIVSKAHLSLAWWIVLPLALGRLVFSAIYRLNAKRNDALWKSRQTAASDDAGQ